MLGARVALLSSLLMALGCASITAGQRADTLGKNRFAVAVETSYQAALESDTVRAYPMTTVAGRYGVTDTIDVGARVGSAGVGTQGKFLLLERDGLQLAVAPSVDWTSSRDDDVGLDTVDTAVPALINLELRPGLELMASPRLTSSLIHIQWAGHTYLHTLGVGSGVGMAVRSRRFWIIPEVGVLWPFLVTGKPVDEMGGTTTRLGRVITQFSVSVVFEGPR